MSSSLALSSSDVTTDGLALGLDPVVVPALVDGAVTVLALVIEAVTVVPDEGVLTDGDVLGALVTVDITVLALLVNEEVDALLVNEEVDVGVMVLIGVTVGLGALELVKTTLVTGVVELVVATEVVLVGVSGKVVVGVKFNILSVGTCVDILTENASI